MQEFKNLEQSMKFISASLLESLTMLDILDEIIDYSIKESTIISNIRNNIKNSFEQTELCRGIVSVPDR